MYTQRVSSNFFEPIYRRLVKYKNGNQQTQPHENWRSIRSSTYNFPPDGIGGGYAPETKATARLRAGLSRPGRNHPSHPRRRRSKGVGVIVFPASVSSRPSRGTCREARSPTRGEKTGRDPDSAPFPRNAKLPTSSRLCGLLTQRRGAYTRSSRIRQRKE